MNSLLHFWAAIVASGAIVMIVVTAMGMMVGLVKVDHAFKRIGFILGFLILLLLMPSIILGIWRSLTFGQQIGIILLAGVGVTVLVRGGASKGKKRQREH